MHFTCLRRAWLDDVILVTGADEIAYCRDEIVGKYGFSKVRAIVAGGKERYHSVYEGLKALGSQLSYGEGDCVLIHDGARPFVDEPMIDVSYQIYEVIAQQWRACRQRIRSSWRMRTDLPL